MGKTNATDIVTRTGSGVGSTGYQSIKIETIAVGNGRRFKTEAIFHQGFAIIDPFVHQFETFHFRLDRFIVTRLGVTENTAAQWERGEVSKLRLALLCCYLNRLVLS